MAKTKEQKKELVQKYKDQITSAKAVYIVESEGISSNEANELKKQLYDLNSTYAIIKNRLFSIAMKESGVDAADYYEKGQHAAIFADEDAISEAAKIIFEFLEEKKELGIKGGLLDNEHLTKDQVESLAKLPGREALLGQLVGTLNAPIAGFVRALNGNISGLAIALNAIKEQKE